MMTIFKTMPSPEVGGPGEVGDTMTSIMKVSKEQSAANRQALVEAASRLYRERGIAGVGLAEIAREAGFTHGGFYGRFASKEELAAEACDQAFEGALGKLSAQFERHGGDLTTLLRRYFGATHRDTPGAGCPMTSLAVDAAREGGQLGQSMSQGIDAYLRALAIHRPDGTVVDEPTPEDQARAIRTLTTMVGAVVLARACGQGAPGLSDQILRTSLEQLTTGA